ncbi:MAG TPA: hypothetical protein VGW35_17895 [Methylomirabilota bacterium]|jgi:hypothetical protein|nr:hypothetical protein [Methylomirabilota bacterium]HEV8673938.1 hypothetical protein [Methylomirabilota bacterium]
MRAWATAVFVSLALAGALEAAEWGGIVPGVSSRRDVETLYGRPSRERTVVEESRTVPEWTYLGERAPRGLERMIISFGLIGPEGFRADLVRGVAIYPKPRIFTLDTIANAWGKPDAMGTNEQTGQGVLRYDAKGLLVVMHRSGDWAEVLLFAPTPGAPKPQN